MKPEPPVELVTVASRGRARLQENLPLLAGALLLLLVHSPWKPALTSCWPKAVPRMFTVGSNCAL